MIRQFLIESLVRLLEAHLEALVESAEKLDFRWVVIFCFPDLRLLYIADASMSAISETLANVGTSCSPKGPT